ncbi:protein kinase [Corallococcus sp. CA053C]|uniref:protein kinase domain-containing protein n=1 Tax=Corallococcus sp. CA053C TaxID=2316732 RepID=UPI000EA2BD9A|nr:SUMF1/EgtB/PvdO family nonheme iron enzyme [Corallococcus sp. CA053C]RKH10697.1 protein kinase [Corallococcus sp. CA053C]
MLCYRCGSHVPDTSETCATCGQKFDAAARLAAGAARKRGTEGAPYKPGDVVANRYAIQEVVGSGPLGFVFRAQDQAIDVEVALKVIQPRLVQQPEERTQFALSMRVGKKLNHPNLVRVYEEGVDGDRPYFAMQLLEGITLRRMMEQRASKGQLFSLKEVEPLLAQMAAALDGAHRFGPHSDLKPENVYVLPDLLKVTDYGLGLAVPHLPFVQAQKGHRAAAYIAPEYVNGAELDTRMDVYSLGVLMGEMVTGLLPEDGGVPEVTVRHPDLPPAFESLYRRALNQNPLARPKSGGELHAEFAALVQRHPAAASRTRAVPPTGALPPAAVAARAANKPLPPVPTGMLPIATAPTPAAPIPVKEDDPPPDATQPLDAATLAAILGSNKQALDYILGPEARSVSDAATQQEMRAVAERQAPGRGGRGSDASSQQDPRALGQAPEAATQQEPRASRGGDGVASAEARPSSSKAAEPVMRIFAKAEEPSFPPDPRASSRSAESGADGRLGSRGADGASDGRQAGRGGDASADSRRGAEGASGDGRSSGRGGETSSSDGRSGGRNGEASSGDARSGGRNGEASASDGRSGGRNGEASSSDGRSGGRNGEASASDGRSGGRNGEASASDGRSGGRNGEASASDARSGGRNGEAPSGDGRSGGRNAEASSGDGRSGGRNAEASSGDGRSGGRNGDASSDSRQAGRGAEASGDGRSAGRNGDASATESRQGGRGADSSQDARSGRSADGDGRQGGRNSDDDEVSESRSSSRGGRNSRASGAVASVNARGADPSGPRGASRASAAQGAVRSSGSQGEASTGGRSTGSRKSEPSPETSGIRSAPRRLPPSVSGLHTLPTTRATQAKPARSGPSAMVWMVVLAVMGVVLGAGGGYLWLRLRQSQAAKNAPVPPPPGPSTGLGAALNCPAGMVSVSGGSFKKGSSKEDQQAFRSSDESLLASVPVESFCVDEFEFPNKQGRKPRVSVSWLDAKGLCAEAGKRLCTENEWEKACKGPGNARFSSGDAPVSTACNTGTAEGTPGALAASGQFGECRFNFGPSDMSGNAAEWTSTPFPSSNDDMIIKGGSFDSPSDASRCAARKRGATAHKDANLGFRCCANPLP